MGSSLPGGAAGIRPWSLTTLRAIFLLLCLVIARGKTLEQHVVYTTSDLPPKQQVRYMADLIDGQDVPMPQTAPTVLVVPGWEHDTATDRGMAAALRTVRDRITDYDTVVLLGAYYPSMCGAPAPSTPLLAYSGDTVQTKLGPLEVDTDLRDEILAQMGTPTNTSEADEMIEQSDYYDQPFLWIRGLFAGAKDGGSLGDTTNFPQTKVLPLLLHATLRSQVDFVSRVLNERLFTGEADDGQYGLAANGKRYLLIIPIQTSSGLSLFQNVYIENVLSHYTFKKDVSSFESWLYYLSGSSGATFSNTVGAQIMVVRLAAMATQRTLEAGGANLTTATYSGNNAVWDWKMLDYYTSFDGEMDRQKMAESPYRTVDPKYKYMCGYKVFSDDEDSPYGHRIYYSMALSLEPPLYESESTKKRGGDKGKKVVSKLPIPVSLASEFSAASMEILQTYVRKALRGETVGTTPADRKRYNLPDELSQPAPYQLRVYVLAEHEAEAKETKAFEKELRKIEKNLRKGKDVSTMEGPKSYSDLQAYSSEEDMCMEQVLFEYKRTDFFPTADIFTSLINEATDLYSETLSPTKLAKFDKDLKKRYMEKVKAGELPQAKMKDIDVDLKASLVVEISVYHSWEYRTLFELTEAKGSFIALWDGRHAVCDVPETKPEYQHVVFFRLTQCALKGGLEPWDWQRGVVHTYDRERWTTNVYDRDQKDEL